MNLTLSVDVHETEWQYDAPSIPAVRRWLTEEVSSTDFLITPEPSRRIHDCYLDTADLAILRAGYALRIRRSGRSVEASLKELAPREGELAVRREITQPLAHPTVAKLFASDGPVSRRVRLLSGADDLLTLAPIRTDRQMFRIVPHREASNTQKIADPHDGTPATGKITGQGEPLATEETANHGEPLAMRKTTDHGEPPVTGQTADPGAPAVAGEIALDRTFLTDRHGRTHRLTRVEIEVPHAHVARFLPFCVRLRDACRLTGAEQSKFAWALAANGVVPDKTMGLGSVTPDPAMPVAQVADAVIRKQTAALLWNEPGTRLGDDPEHLHDMRVACRRLRAALKLFAGAYPQGKAANLRARLGDIGRLLGQVRDLDVFIEQLRERAGHLVTAGPADGKPLLEHLHHQREQEREAMIRGLDDPSFVELKNDLRALLTPPPGEEGASDPNPAAERFVHAEDERTREASGMIAVSGASPPAVDEAAAAGPVATESITKFGREAIRRVHRKMSREARGLKEDSPASAYHAVRIRGKRLRYALEFHADIYGNAAREMIEVLVEVQDVLGAHQDDHVFVERLQALVRERPAGFTPSTWSAVGELVQSYLADAERRRAEVPKLIRRLEKKRWKALRRRMKALAKDRRRGRGESNAPVAPNAPLAPEAPIIQDVSDNPIDQATPSTVTDATSHDPDDPF